MVTARENNSQRIRMAVWAITPNGVRMAVRIGTCYPASQLFLSQRAYQPDDFQTYHAPVTSAHTFESLKQELAAQFNRYDAHIFIFATGIAVRMISPLLESKVKDPAVVVVDEKGFHAISLVSGHMGGANALAVELAEKINAMPVITTATDINDLPSIDMIAVENDLRIQNPPAIKHVNMKILKGIPLKIYDPERILLPLLSTTLIHEEWASSASADIVCTWKNDKVSRETLVLRPKVLSLGIGCNRGTTYEDIILFVRSTAEEKNFSLMSLRAIGTTEVKADEAGILELGNKLNLDLIFYTKDQLNSVESIKNPSKMAEKYLGVKSVCEAAAILAASNGKLIMPKRKTKDVTLAVAKVV